MNVVPIVSRIARLRRMGDLMGKYVILCVVLASALAGGEAEAAVPAESSAVAASPLGRYIVVLRDGADLAA